MYVFGPMCIVPMPRTNGRLRQFTGNLTLDFFLLKKIDKEVEEAPWDYLPRALGFLVF